MSQCVCMCVHMCHQEFVRSHVNVFADTVVPTLPWVDIISNNAKHTTLAKAADTIFLTVNASEFIDLPTVTLAARSAYVAVYRDYVVHYLYTSSQVYNATITVVSGDIQGNTSLTVVFEDPAGNKGTTVTTVTLPTSNSGFVTIGEYTQLSACCNLCAVCSVLLCSCMECKPFVMRASSL